MSVDAGGVDDRRADMSAVLEQMKADAPPESEGGGLGLAEEPLPTSEAPQSAGPVGETAEEKAQRARDEAGRFAKEPKAKPASKAPVVEKKPGLAAVPKPQEAAPATQPAAAPKTPAVKAPASWRPEVREKWAGLPPEVQAEVVRREREVDATLQRAKPALARAEGWDKLLQPYAATIQATGLQPHQAVGQMLQAQHVLTYGAPTAKAGMLAQIINGYGVPIEALAKALDGQASGTLPQATSSAQPYRDPRVDQLFATLQQRKAAMDQSAQQEAASLWGEFSAANEFAEDLREEIADQMEVGNRNGRGRTLEQAYAIALHAHPELSKVVSQREAAKAATAQSAATQAKKAAAVSLKSVPGGVGEEGAPTTGHVGDDLRYVLGRLKSR